MEKVSYFQKHKRDPVHLLPFSHVIILVDFFDFKGIEQETVQGGREDHCGVGGGCPVLLAPQFLGSIGNKWDRSSVF